MWRMMYGRILAGTREVYPWPLVTYLILVVLNCVVANPAKERADFKWMWYDMATKQETKSVHCDMMETILSFPETFNRASDAMRFPITIRFTQISPWSFVTQSMAHKITTKWAIAVMKGPQQQWARLSSTTRPYSIHVWKCIMNHRDHWSSVLYHPF